MGIGSHIVHGARKRVLLGVMVAIVIATITFILLRSMQGSDGSWAESNAVAALFEPLLRRLYGLSGDIAALLGGSLLVDYGTFVRKLAHFLEYLLLGAECTALTVVLVGRVVSPYLWADLFVVLMAAVIDEFVQSFMGRTSLVGDVLLDFSGALVGIVLGLAIASALTSVKRRASRD